MKLITAIVRPFTLDRVIVALESIDGFPGMTVIDSEGFGQRLRSEADAVDPLRPNKRIDIVAKDEMADSIIAVLKEAAHTGKKGDGLIFSVPVEVVTVI